MKQHTSPPRPQRIRITGSAGKAVTLAQGSDAFVSMGGTAKATGHVVLGLGPLLPDEASISSALPHKDLAAVHADVLWLECPEFMAAMQNVESKESTEASAAQTPWQQRIPPHWKPVEVAQLFPALAGRHIWWHRQNVRLFPDFWAKVLGQVQAYLLRGGASVPELIILTVHLM